MLLRRGWLSLVCCVTLCSVVQSHGVQRQCRESFQSSLKVWQDRVADFASEGSVEVAMRVIPESLEDSDACFFVEALCIAKLSNLLKNEISSIFSEGPSFVQSSISLVTSTSSEQVAGCIHRVQETISDIVAGGFSHEEINSSKNAFLTLIDELVLENKGEDLSYLFSAMEKEFHQTFPHYNYIDFLLQKRSMIANVDKEELDQALQRYFHAAKMTIEIEPAKEISSSYDLYPFRGHFTDFFEEHRMGLQGFASLKKGFSYQNTPFANVEQYYNLTLSESDKKNIRRIIVTMADKNVFQLLLEKKELEKIGKHIRHVHPLRFLGYICSDGSLRRALKTISSNHFKWSSFIDGFKDKMKEESRRGQIIAFLSGFAEHLNVDAHAVGSFVNRSDYEGLVRYCM